MSLDNIDRQIGELTAIKNYNNVVAVAKKLLEENAMLKKKIGELERKSYVDMLNEIDRIMTEMLKEAPNLSKEVIESGIPGKVMELAAIHHFRRSDLAPIVAECTSLVHDVLASKRKDKNEG